MWVAPVVRGRLSATRTLPFSVMETAFSHNGGLAAYRQMRSLAAASWAGTMVVASMEKAEAQATVQVAPAHHGRERKDRDPQAFSIHPWVQVPAEDPAGRERLCRYAERPAFAKEALGETEDGKVRVKMRKARTSGATHVELEKVQFLRRVAWLIPPPKKHMVTYSGILAPAAKLRHAVVPLPEVELKVRSSVEDLIDAPNLKFGNYIPWAKLLKRVSHCTSLVHARNL